MLAMTMGAALAMTGVIAILFAVIARSNLLRHGNLTNAVLKIATLRSQ